MFAYAEWLVLECDERPTRTQRLVRAKGFARAPVYDRVLRELEERPDFVKYCDELAKGPLEAARAKFQKAFPTYIEAHAEALDSARRAGDYTAVARIAEPVLDRVIPKKAEGMGAAAAVTIILSPGQLKGFSEYTPASVECEVVEASVEDANGTG